MRKLLTFLALGLCLLAPRVVFAQGAASFFDPCAQLPKQSVAINLSTTGSTTTKLLAAPTDGSSIYLCSMELSQSSEPVTFKLEYGTKVSTDCDTGATALTGIYTGNATATGQPNNFVIGKQVGGSFATAPANTEVCAVTTGTAIQQGGWLSYVQTNTPQVANFFDPCIQYPKLSAPLQYTSATTTQLVAGVANTAIYVCGVHLQQVGAAGPPTFQFEQGTGTTCGTGTAVLDGVISGNTTASTITSTLAEGNGTELALGVGNALCGVSTTTANQAGWVSYVQK